VRSNAKLNFNIYILHHRRSKNHLPKSNKTWEVRVKYLSFYLWLIPLAKNTLLIRWGASQVQFFKFIYCNKPIGLAHHSKKKWNYGGSSLKYSVPPLWPTYIGERRITFGKADGIKVRCYGEHVTEHIGNLGNIVRTHWEPGKKQNKTQKKKTTWSLGPIG
jgi:hypothetical protein